MLIAKISPVSIATIAANIPLYPNAPHVTEWSTILTYSTCKNISYLSPQ